MALKKLLTATHKGTHTKKASTSALTRGTRKGGKSPFPSMAKGPVRSKARDAGVG